MKKTEKMLRENRRFDALPLSRRGYVDGGRMPAARSTGFNQESVHRRVLVISYYFPPSGGSGVQRPLKFVKYLGAFGWEPVVLSVRPEYAAYPDLDEGMVGEIPEEVACFRTRSWDPYRLYARWTGKARRDAVTVGFLSDRSTAWKERVARWVRANLFIPDARVGWVPYAVREATRLIRVKDVTAVITTGPPHSTHLIGRTLHRRLGIPWIADFRDPWTAIDFIEKLPMTRRVHALNRKLEQSVLDEADRVITISPTMQHDFAQKTNTPCQTILNGFDQEDYSEAIQHDEKAFVIAHIGNMNGDRNPGGLWEVLGRNENRDIRSDLRIRLVGNVDQAVIANLESAGLQAYFERVDYLPHREAVAYQRSSSVLLLPINRVQSSKGIVTGKLFEYLAARKPILGIGPPDGDAGLILKETGAGEMIDYDDFNRIDRFIRTAYQQWKTGALFAEDRPEALASFSRKYQTGLLASLLDELVEGGAVCES